MTEPTYLEPDRYDLSSPLIGFDSPLESSQTQPFEISPPDSTATNQLIFRSLTQILSPLGVKFKFSIQSLVPMSAAASSDSQEHTILQSPDLCFQALEYRLLIVCFSPTSLDSQLIAEPLARALRGIELQGFQEAIIQYSRFSALQSAPTSTQLADWRLRVDLTPPATKLSRWARWGDVQAITQLLNVALASADIQISTVLKNLTLQIFCTLKHERDGKFPAKKIVLDAIAPLLISLTPQGIQGATIYGVQLQPELGGQIESPPVWIHWLDLPALGDPKFSLTPIILASRGDEDALTFILERLLNPDLERFLDIGGVSLSLLHRHHLLHVMSEAPICPIQSQVATTVVKVLQQLALPGIKGVRVHGRISGYSISQWTYGVDFNLLPLELPPVVLERQFIPTPLLPKVGLSERISKYLVKTGIWKPQLTIDSTSQLAYQPRFQWQPSLLLFIAGLGCTIASNMAIESVMKSRQIVADAVVASPQLSFNNPLLEQKLAQYQLRCLQHGVPDVLIVGSSRAMRGIDPQVLRRSFFTNRPNLQIYNFGINGATAQVVDTILRQLLTPQQLPKLVIWADGARAFNSGRTDRTYETIATSDRYRQLARMLGFKNNTSTLFQAQSAFQTTYQAIDTAIDRRLASVSLAYNRRDTLKNWLRATVPEIEQLTDRDALNDVDLATMINERDIDFDGFLPLDLQFDPDTYYQKYTKVTGDNDGDYLNFQLHGNQDRALHQTIELLAASKVPLVFVNMPLSDLYLDKVRRQYETSFQQYMQQLMADGKLTFIDMADFSSKKYARFSDPSHLNKFGAIEVSKHLATAKGIKW
ncbi:DUF1574 family protein [Chamaesiphon minutus]|uniref:DUF1574 domain-containing protein n=1 Tax=Chamaesiphon minutus (strain ATCC 27169 / PCC 6605) TaxID=1173020 RepID=K9ULW7_CHAP6|nr:DUF1574 family protein [Chamaesiphon minutus]AFY95658.1 hypothetical protein Cha6605_4742 [Chamaesiphon minutus PCC 6605]